MSIVVMKFGGTSVADAEKIRTAAARAIRTHKTGKQVVIVVSAMGGNTDRLVGLASQICADPPKRELDQLLATGEQVTIALAAMALEDMGCPAISFTAGQIGLITDEVHTKAKIRTIDAKKIHRELNAGRIVIVAGFQGVTDAGHVTTLGRGGSNVTLVALAASLGAEVCENFTDVDGIFTADPRIVPNAVKINQISYDEMLELASLGAGVLHNRAVEFAKKYNVVLHVRNSSNRKKGTLIVPETQNMERVVVSGTALKSKLAKVTIEQIPNTPGIAAKIFHTLATNNIIVDDIIQTIAKDSSATVSFTIEQEDISHAKKVVKQLCAKGSGVAYFDEGVAKVSAVGLGMRIHTGVADKMFGALAKAKINIENITTSEIKISCIIRQEQGKKALRIVHDAFNLGTKKVKKVKKRK